MKQLILIFSLLIAFSATAQEKDSLSQEEKERREQNIQAGNPFKKYGYTPKIATLSKGKYLEWHDLDSIVIIGSVYFNTKTKKVIDFVERDMTNPDAQPLSDIRGRWISPDPLAEEFPSWSPYNFVYNNPLTFTDPTGLAAESIHLDKYGTVLKNVDDGDDGVYVHNEAKTEADVNKTYSAENTSAGGDKIGEIGGVINVDGIYSNLLRKNMQEAKDIWNPFTFRDYVKTNGEWDLKNNDSTIYGLGNDGKTQFSFQGNLMESQDIGNHHFGAVSLAYGLFPGENFILKQAGEFQIKSGTSKPEWQIYRTKTVTDRWGQKSTIREMLPPYGDDPRDQKWIKSGFQFFKNR
ncbi:MAG: polymorphic toxin type 44 domain-containing protein [Weeksellaceae bacterium]